MPIEAEAKRQERDTSEVNASFQNFVTLISIDRAAENSTHFKFANNDTIAIVMRLELAARSRQHILPIILLFVPQPSGGDEKRVNDPSLAPTLHFLDLKLPVSQF